MSLKEEVYATWAPAGSIWSPWAKPVLFAHLSTQQAVEPSVPPAMGLDSVPPADGGEAIVVDLPGDLGIAAGLALARIGYRPVPLYNACPGPMPVVDVAPILRALGAGAAELAGMQLSEEAPPAFLLDSRRRGDGARRPGPGTFDNRSISLPTDFPSANLLLSRGIGRVLLLQESARPPRADLAHTLRRWQEAGIAIESAGIDASGPTRIQVPRPSWFGSMFHAFFASLGLRRNVLGGYGGTLPAPGAG